MMSMEEFLQWMADHEGALRVFRSFGGSVIVTEVEVRKPARTIAHFAASDLYFQETLQTDPRSSVLDGVVRHVEKQIGEEQQRQADNWKAMIAKEP